MGRATYLLMLAFVSAPAFAAQGNDAARAVDGPSAIRIAASFGVITSAWRSPEHNRAVGGVPNSYHLHGRAIDIARRPGVTHRQIDAALRKAGYNLIESLDEGDHSHFAFGPGKSPVNLDPAIAYPPPPTPTSPAVPHLAADDHGSLVVDSMTTAASPVNGED